MKAVETAFRLACEIGGGLLGDEIVTHIIRPHTSSIGRIWMRLTGALTGCYIGDQASVFGLKLIGSTVELIKRLEPV